MRQLLCILFIGFGLMFFSCDIFRDKTPTNGGNYSLSFDGIDDFAIVNQPDMTLKNIRNEITLEGWIFVRSFPNAYPYIINASDNNHSAPSGDRYILALSRSDQCVRMNINGYVLDSNPIEYDRWTHVAGTYDGQVLKIYINGILEISQYIETTIDVKESSLYIGNNPENTRQFDGMINSLRIWNQALSKNYIYEIYDTGIEDFSDNAICCWTFNEGYGQIAYDQCGHNNLQLGSLATIDENDPEWVRPVFYEASNTTVCYRSDTQ